MPARVLRSGLQGTKPCTSLPTVPASNCLTRQGRSPCYQKAKLLRSSFKCSAEAGKSAVIIVDHGSRRRESNEQLDRFIDMYRQASDKEVVVAAHMEIASPSIEEAMQKCVEAGCSSITVAPYFLSNGRHIQQDIPTLVSEAQAKYPEINCAIADPIGLDAGVVDIIKRRVSAAKHEKDRQTRA